MDLLQLWGGRGRQLRTGAHTAVHSGAHCLLQFIMYNRKLSFTNLIIKSPMFQLDALVKKKGGTC